MTTSVEPVTVVGIGADGWSGLTAAAREVLRAARVIVGSPRQTASLREQGLAAHLADLPTPLLPALETLLATPGLCLLASGDPMLHGLGSTIRRLHPSVVMRVIPAVSSVSLACARLGWSATETAVVSLVSQPVESVLPSLTPGARVLILARNGSTCAEVAKLLDSRGWGESTITCCDELGSDHESLTSATVSQASTMTTNDLTVLAVECHASMSMPPAARSRVPGLDDECFETDGALTRREIRALSLSALEPAPGHLLWDIGTGSGSIAIEWLRTDPSTHAIAVEPRADRIAIAARNATALGVPRLTIIEGKAPDALLGLAAPDAVFIGGGVTTKDLVETCWAALKTGGRLVANSVTLESEDALRQACAALGGELIRIESSHLDALGTFTTWRPELPVTQWRVRKA